jgi:beta-galactosidase
MLRNGSLPGLHLTASFGSRSVERLATLREHQPTGPLMCMEYWDGWFDSWGQYHHTTSPEESAADLDALLASGASVNLYMFHGGTNFGLTSGANDRGVFAPITTSYDYDAPLDEAGRPGPKYAAYREVLGRYTTLPAEVPADAAPAPAGTVMLEPAGSLFEAAAALPTVATDDVPGFGAVAHDAALLIHTSEVRTEGISLLRIGTEVRDRVHVLVDGNPVGILSRELGQTTLALPPAHHELTLVVEHQGHVNYGPRIGEEKGLIGEVTLGGEPLGRWRTTALRLEDLAPGTTAPAADGIPGLQFARGRFEVDASAAAADRFLDTTGLGKGIAWINGFCLGRYWSRPPQRTLYIPGPVLRPGSNELLVLELDGAPSSEVRFVADADLGPVES